MDRDATENLSKISKPTLSGFTTFSGMPVTGSSNKMLSVLRGAIQSKNKLKKCHKPPQTDSSTMSKNDKVKDDRISGTSVEGSSTEMLNVPQEEDERNNGTYVKGSSTMILNVPQEDWSSNIPPNEKGKDDQSPGSSVEGSPIEGLNVPQVIKTKRVQKSKNVFSKHKQTADSKN